MKNSSAIRLPGLRTRAAGLLTATLLAAHVTPNHAQTASTWNGGSGNWSDATFWTPNGAPNSTSNDVRVDGGNTGAASTVNVDGSYSVGRLTVDAGDTVAINSAASAGAGGERGLFFSPGAFSGAGALVNNGTVTLNATGAYTGVSDQLVNLRADGTSLVLTGAGTVLMTDSTNNRILGNSLSFGAGHTVRGGGQIFAPTIANAGLLDGTGATYGIILSPTNLTNTGTLRASAGGRFTLSGGTTDNTGGAISALAGSTVLLTDGASVTGGTLSTVGTGVIRSNNVTLANVTNAGALALNAGDRTTLAAGAITNTGVITLNATGAYVGSQAQLADLRYNGNVTLTGAGALTLTDATNNRIFSDQSATSRLTVGPGQTIRGAGRLMETGSALTNQGLLDATGTTFPLTVFVAGADRIVNTGTMQASGGGTLQLSGFGNSGSYTVTNAGGAIQALTGSTVRLDNSVNVTGGTLTTSGAGAIAIGAATITNLTNSGAITVAGPGQPTLSTAGTIFNNGGQINVTSTGGVNDLFVAADTTIYGAGAVTLSGPGSSNNARIFGHTGARLINDGNHTIQGVGQIGLGFIAVTNGARINANVTGGVLDITPANVPNAFVNTVSGIVSAFNGGIITLSNSAGGSFTNNGVFRAFDSDGLGSQFNIAPGALTNFVGTTLTGGSYSVASVTSGATTTLTFGGGSIVTNNASVTLNGRGTAIPEINALANNQGTFKISDGRNFTTAGALTNSGRLEASNTSTLTVTGPLTNSGVVFLTGGPAAAPSALSVQGTLTSSGTLATLGSSTVTITATGALTQSAAGQIVGNGTISAPTLTLVGALRPGDNVNSSNVVLPAVGFLTLAGQVNLAGTTLLDFDLGALAASDRLQVNGGLNLDGTLNVAAVSGFGVGRYDLLDYTGTLTNNVLDLGTVPAGYTYAVDLSTAGQVNLIVSAVPEPSTYALALGGLGLLLLGQRRVSRSRRGPMTAA